MLSLRTVKLRGLAASRRVAARSALAAASATAARRNGAAATARRAFHAAAAVRAPATIRVEVDGQPVDVPAGSTVMQACEQAGVNIPRFCYHDRLSIAGNCRMCLVEVEKSPKPQASCAMPIMPGMKVKTNTPLVHKAREGVMEFLLANHPLDCPICDQGGECDLQDQSMSYGSDRTRNRFYKRTVEDKNIGPLVKTVMTRCIHCTRCIRFTTEVCGVSIMGATGRGNAMEIGTYTERMLDTEMSGNVIDLCPVGALTSKPFAFTSRPWELSHTESIDVLDAVGSNIRIDTRGAEVMRVLPRLNEDVNEEWISDKTRFSYDGLKRQRLDTPLVRKGDEFVPVSWEVALNTIRERIATDKIRGDEMLAVAGDMADAEGIVALKDLFNRLGSSNTYTALALRGLDLSVDNRSDYLFNSRITGIEDADVVLLVGTNPRMEAPIVATRLRKAVRQLDLNVAYVGPKMDLAMKAQQIGEGTDTLKALADGTHPFAATLKAAKNPLIIVGMGALVRADGRAVYAAAEKLAKSVNALRENWKGLSVLHTAASQAAAGDLGFVPGPQAKHAPAPKFVYLLGADDEAVDAQIPANAFVVYAGHHGDVGANRADVILPSPAYTEKFATYVNTEGRVQRTQPATPVLKNARDDWAILRGLSEVLGAPLPYDDLHAVRARLADVAPHMANADALEPFAYRARSTAADAEAAPLAASAFAPFWTNHFMTNPISRSSKVMAKCVATLPRATNSYLTPTAAAARTGVSA